jgi:cobalt/nickel transport system permease protein
MTHEEFSLHDSVIHRIEPKVRIISATVLSVCAALGSHLGIVPAYLALSLMLVGAARLNAVSVLKRIRPLFWFLIMIWIIVPVTFEGPFMAQWGFVRISSPGVLMCSMVTLKSISIVLIFTSLIATMPVSALGAGLHRLNVPDKMVFLLLMSYRYISVIENEYRKLLRAARFRGFVPGTNLHSYKTFAYLAGMLFVRASMRAQRVHQAMICRGFAGRFHTLDVYPPNRLNSIFLAVSLVAGTLLLYFDFFRMGT